MTEEILAMFLDATNLEFDEEELDAIGNAFRKVIEPRLSPAVKEGTK